MVNFFVTSVNAGYTIIEERPAERHTQLEPRYIVLGVKPSPVDKTGYVTWEAHYYKDEAGNTRQSYYMGHYHTDLLAAITDYTNR